MKEKTDDYNKGPPPPHHHKNPWLYKLWNANYWWDDPKDKYIKNIENQRNCKFSRDQRNSTNAQMKRGYESQCCLIFSSFFSFFDIFCTPLEQRRYLSVNSWLNCWIPKKSSSMGGQPCFVQIHLKSTCTSTYDTKEPFPQTHI